MKNTKTDNTENKPTSGKLSDASTCSVCDSLNAQSDKQDDLWIKCEEQLPDLGQIVWLYDGERVWTGSRDGIGDWDQGWLWTNSYHSLWHDGYKWDADCEADDDYQPIYWMRLPILPNVKLTGSETPTKTQ